MRKASLTFFHGAPSVHSLKINPIQQCMYHRLLQSGGINCLKAGFVSDKHDLRAWIANFREPRDYRIATRDFEKYPFHSRSFCEIIGNY